MGIAGGHPTVGVPQTRPNDCAAGKEESHHRRTGMYFISKKNTECRGLQSARNTGEKGND